MTTNAPARYVPAAGRFVPTRLYDPAVALTMRESLWRARVADELLAGGRVRTVLDVGCGTGTLAVELARRAPDTAISGIDGDPEILGRASIKAIVAGVEVDFREAFATALPFTDGSFDRVTSSLVLHHLSHRDKARSLAEIHRVLRPKGRVVIADWGRGQDPLMRAAFFGLRLLDGFENTADHASGALGGMVADAGFGDVRRAARWRTIAGTLELLVASRA